MKVTYDSQQDTLRILFCDAPISETETHRAGLILDYDQHGRVVGLELAAASEQMTGPELSNYAEYSLMPAEKVCPNEE